MTEKLSKITIGVLIIIYIIIAMLFLGGFGIQSDTYRSFNPAMCPMRQSLTEHNSFIWWDIYRAGGQALISAPGIVFEITYFLFLLFNNPNIALGLSALIYIAWGITGMYLLVFRFTKNNKACVLSVLFFWFWIYQSFPAKFINRIAFFCSLPWIFLLYHDMNGNLKRIIRNSIIIGIIVAVTYFAYALNELVWLFFAFPIYVFLDIFLFPNKRSDIFSSGVKLLAIVLIMMVVFLGLSAFVLYPSTKYIEKTNRNQPWTLQQFIGETLVLRDFFKYNLQGLVDFNYSKDPWMKTGVVALLISLGGLYFGYKKKTYLKFLILILVSIVVAANLFSIAKLLILIPFLNKTRFLIRIGPIYQFSIAVLVGVSFSYIYDNLKQRKWAKHLFVLLVILLTLELTLVPVIRNLLFGRESRYLDKEIDNYEVFKYLANTTTERHRIHMLGIDWVEGGEGEQYFCNYGIETMDWVFGNAWLIDYTTFTMWAGSNLEQGAKLWGMLNTKYVTALDPNKIEPTYTKAIYDYKNETDYFVPGLELVKRFPSCEECSPNLRLLYENERFLPRAYLVNKSILIFGDKNQLYGLYNYLLLNRNFEPKTTVLIGKNDISGEDLSRYSAVIITRQLDITEADIIRKYAESDGILLPDIFNNENQINPEKLDNLLIRFKEGNLTKAEEKYYSPNHRIYTIQDPYRGWLILSENFYTYRDEWKSSFNSKDKEIYNANFINAAVYLGGEAGDLEFEYTAKYFRRGSVVSIVTLIIVIGILVYMFRRKNSIKVEDQ